MTSKEKDVDYERIVREIRLARHQQKKRLYEQAKRQRKEESKIVAASNVGETND